VAPLPKAARSDERVGIRAHGNGSGNGAQPNGKEHAQARDQSIQPAPEK
jgi:hypothetical protein